MSNKPTIFVTAATSKVGSQVARSLNRNQYNIRLGVRNLEKAQQLKKEGWDIIPFDFEKKNTLSGALQGVHAVLLIPSRHENRVKQALNVIQAAKEAGVEYLVLFSVCGAPEKKTIFQKQFSEIEDTAKNSGLKTIIVEASYFQENVLNMKEGAQIPLKDGSIPMVSIYDIGRSLAQILQNPEQHVGKMYLLTGPKLETGDSIAKIVSECFGKQIKYENIPPTEMKKKLMQRGMPEWEATGIVEAFDEYAQKRYDVTDHVQKLTGQPPRGLSQTLKACKGGQAE